MREDSSAAEQQRTQHEQRRRHAQRNPRRASGGARSSRGAKIGPKGSKTSLPPLGTNSDGQWAKPMPRPDRQSAAASSLSSERAKSADGLKDAHAERRSSGARFEPAAASRKVAAIEREKDDWVALEYQRRMEKARTNTKRDPRSPSRQNRRKPEHKQKRAYDPVDAFLDKFDT